MKYVSRKIKNQELGRIRQKEDLSFFDDKIPKARQFSGPLAGLHKVAHEAALRIELEKLFLFVLDKDRAVARDLQPVDGLYIEVLSRILDPHDLFERNDTPRPGIIRLGRIFDDHLGESRRGYRK